MGGNDKEGTSSLMPLLDPGTASGTSSPNGSPQESIEGHPIHPHSISGQKKIGVLTLAALTYFGVSGGPFGMEPAVQAGGPLVTLVGMGVMPLLWSLPEALITAELAPAFPEASGYVAWATHAFGPFWGFMKGYLAWCSGVADNALYPVLILNYTIQIIKAAAGKDYGLEEGPIRMAILMGLTAVLTFLNYRGLDVVGKTAMGICVLSLLPMVVMVIIGLPQVDFSRLSALPEGGIKNVDWAAFINVCFWNLNYWDNSSSFAGEVIDPGRTYPRAMAVAVLMVVVTTALPLLVGVGATTNPSSDWDSGFFATIGLQLGGPWLQWWIVLGCAVSSIGMFESEMSSDSFQVMGMAERGLLPGFLARRSKFNTPPYGILLSAMGIVGLVLLRFDEIIELLNFLYCFSQLIGFAAFIKLRIAHPNLYRPFRIPVNLLGAVVMLICPVTLLFYILYLASAMTWAICGAFVGLGCILYYALCSQNVRALCYFVSEPHLDDVHIVEPHQGFANGNGHGYGAINHHDKNGVKDDDTDTDVTMEV